MKKIRTFLGVFLFILLLALLTSCGNKDTFKISEKYEAEQVYEVSSNEPFETYATNNTFYYLMHQQDSLYEIHSYHIATDNENVVAISIDENENVSGLAVDSKEGYWLLVTEYANDNRDYYLNKYNADGILEDEVKIKEIPSEEPATGLFVNFEGEICVQTMSSVYKYSTLGKYIGQENIRFDFNQYAEIADSQYLVLEQGNIVYYNGEKAETVLNLLNYNFLMTDVKEIHTYGENDNFYILEMKLKDSGYILSAYAFNQVSQSDNEGKQTITLATYGYLGVTEEQMIAEYNMASSEYMVEVIDYSTGGATKEDVMIKLGAEIASGKGPDIINNNVFDMDSLAGKGYLEDLFPYFEMDETVDSSEYLENILFVYEEDNHLYQIPITFMVTTGCAKGDLVGEYNSLSLDNLYVTMEENPQIQTIMGKSKGDTLYYLVMYNLDLFVNEATETCSFDDEAFKRLLTFIHEREKSNELFAEYERTGITENPYERIQKEKQLLHMETMYGNVMFQYANSVIENMVVIGLPCSDGSGSYAGSSGVCFSLAADSDCKAGAWDFMKFALSKEQQDKYIDNGDFFAGIVHPVLKSSFNKYIENVSTPIYVTLDDGTKVEQEITSLNGCSIYAMTEKEKEQFVSLIESIENKAYSGDELLNIIVEEAEYYFNNQKTVDEVVKVIQSRALIYIQT